MTSPRRRNGASDARLTPTKGSRRDVTPLFSCRSCGPQDDDALRRLMRAQMSIDAGWPPDYAKSMDLALWLREPCTLGRWVAVDESDRVAGHVGLSDVPEGAVANLLCPVLDCRPDDLAEICRMVVDPAARMHGLASLLTRKAMRTAIEARRIPIATVLSNRDSWLDMMLRTGWRSVGRTLAKTAGADLFVLAPAERFVELAMGRGEHG